MTPLSITLRTTAQDIADALCDGSNEDAKAVILAIDLQMAHAGFTEEVIKALCASLQADYAGTDDYAQLLAELASEAA